MLVRPKPRLHGVQKQPGVRSVHMAGGEHVKSTIVRISVLVLTACVAAWCLATPAHAYLDPGAGNALLQGIIGGVAVVTGFLAYHWQRLRALLHRRDRRDAHTESRAR